MKHNLLKSLIISVILLMGVSNAWAYNFTKGTVIYFDNTLTNWNTINLRVGTSSNQIWSNSYNNWEKVSGTESLYKLTLPECNAYAAFSFANNSGWTGNNTIYQPYNNNGVKPDGDYKITQQTEYFKWDLDHTRMFIPASTLNTENQCTYFNTTVIYDNYKNTVNLVPHEGGTVTISYTNENGQNITKTDGEFTVAQTCILTVESVDPNDGYEFNQVSFYDGQNYHVKKIGDTFTVRAGTTIYPEFVTSETNKVYLKLSNSDWTQVDATIAVYAWYDVYIDGISPGDWFVMHKIPSKDNNIYSCEIPKGYTGFSFVRLCPSGHNEYVADNNGFNWDNKWNQSEDLTFTEVITEYPFGEKFYDLTDKPNDKYTGTWTKSKSVKIDPCEYGKFGIIFDNEMIWCNVTPDLGAYKEIKIPTDAKIEIIDFEESSLSPEYMLNPRYKYSTLVQKASTADFINLDDIGLVYTVTEDIWVVPNIVTSQPHTVYLHIPDDFKNDWNGAADYKWNTMYLKDYLSGGQIIRDSDQKRVAHLLTAEKDVYLSNQEQGEYWYFNIPAGYHTFIIERKNNNNDDNTGEGGGDRIRSATPTFYFRSPLDKKMCYTLTEKTGDKSWIGEWGTMPNCTITLGYCEFGTHGIKYNGQEYFASNDEKTNVEIVVPYGAEVEVLAGRPLSNAYTNHIEMKVNNMFVKTFKTFNGTDNKVAIVGNTLFDDCYLTKEPHDVYIGIPNTGMDNIWYQKIADESNNNALVDGDIYVWPLAQNVGQGLAVKTDKFENDGVTYYKFTLPAGINDFRFERKAYNGGGTVYCRSKNLTYEIPLNEENCYMLDKGKTPDSHYTGYWTSMPANEDFRILYVEQIVTKKEQVGDEWITEVKRTYEHSSDIIKKRNTSGSDIVSLHIYTRGKNPEIILQQYDESTKKWKDIEAHMVNGPLDTDDPGHGLLPGRKNATPGSDIDDFVYDDGIEKIKNDPTDDGCGVWNFTVYQDGTSAKLDLINESGLKRYEGKYYIRTANAEGKWIDYTIPANHMTFSPYAKQHHGEYFSHYFCKWVDQNKQYRDISFMIANDYAKSLTDPSYLFEDQYVDNQWLPESTNIRWGWSIINNKVSRAYIAGSYNGQNEFLVVNGNDDKVQLQDNINGENGYFNDNTNWLYYADLDAQPEAQVIVRAKYNGDYQYFMGKANEYQKLIGGDYATDKRYYPIRILYDFKEHRFVVGYHPDSKIVGQDVAIETPVMLIRRHHDAPNQISFDITARKIDAPMPAYGVITFLEEKLKAQNISKNEKMFYWVSFPFDVRISHAFGLGEYGSHWVMEEYDGEARAEEGWNIYNTFWRYITDTATTLKAGKGYVLCLNYNRVINEAFLSDKNEEISLYFPSIKTVDQSTIQSRGEKEVPIPTWTGAAPQKDHNWNLIGAISYANTGEKTQQSNSKFLYEYQPADDTYSPRTSYGYNFKALHAYMVQYAGSITWTSHIAPKAIAAKENATSEDEIHRLSLDLIYNDKTLDQTFFQLEDGEATQMFDLNIDMTKIINSGANIYSISSDNNQLAGNVLPIQETVIPVGVVITAAGEYTFAMPEGTDGIVVELIDYETNTRTNMLLDNYTVNLGKGTFDNRFALHVKPDKTTTSVDNIGNEATGDKVKKYLIDGVLYMQKDGVLYDAQGRKL